MAVEAEPSPRSTEGTQETKLAIAVEDEIFRLSPHYVLGLIMLRAPTTGLACETSRSSKTLAEAEERIRKEYSDVAAFIASPRIVAWREAYRRAGVNPKRFPCASEALGSRVIKGKDLPRLGAIVDVCNATSLETGLPVAACDLDGVASGAIRSEGNRRRVLHSARKARASGAGGPGGDHICRWRIKSSFETLELETESRRSNYAPLMQYPNYRRVRHPRQFRYRQPHLRRDPPGRGIFSVPNPAYASPIGGLP